MSEPKVFAWAANFIWTNARLLDRQRFACNFLGAPSDSVVVALRPYQNADGGFGNALEPDKRCPDSQPVDVETALRVLDDLDDAAIWRDPMIGRVLGFLEAITTSEGGIPWVLPSVRNYPRAPWWDAGDNPPASVNPTAAIAGLLIKHGISHPWIERASAFCWRKLADDPTEDVHSLLCLLTFLENAPDRPRAERELNRIGERILSRGLAELDPAGEGYVKKPLDWAPTPTCWAAQLFDDKLLEAHLDALVARQQPDVGWAISWPPLSPLVELEWRGFVTVEALKTLRAYGRL